MAFPLLTSLLFLLFSIISTSTSSFALSHLPSHLSTTDAANVNLPGELFSPGVIRSSPARPMPSYDQNAAPVPLPEFPILGPPIVWSFPAAPLPLMEAPPPQDMPALPRNKHVAPSPLHCHGRHHRKHGYPAVVAAEPAVSPGPLEAPDSAPEPTAGGPSPPY